MTFTVKSNSFKDGDYLGQAHILSADFGFGCAGGNQSPHLSWSGAPAGTKSFAVTCFDPDAPTGSGFWHWLVVNIPSGVTELALDAGNAKAPKLPPGALQTRNDVGTAGYIGPCPPEGDHPAGHRGHLGGTHRVPAPFQHPGEGGDHGAVQALSRLAGCISCCEDRRIG